MCATVWLRAWLLVLLLNRDHRNHLDVTKVVSDHEGLVGRATWGGPPSSGVKVLRQGERQYWSPNQSAGRWVGGIRD